MPIADFDLISSACLEQNIELVNNSTNADRFEWDFCLDDFKTLNSSTDLAIITGLSSGFGYKIVEDNGMWFGFVVSQATHSIIRLDFGASPFNVPTIVNLGNPGTLLLFPQGIDLYKNDNMWYAFVGFNDNNYGLVRLDFGISLTNVPTAINIGNFGVGGRFWDLRVVKQGVNLILVIAERNTGSIIRVNYRNSFLNSINPGTDVFNTGAIPGAAFTPGIDIINRGSDWIALLTSLSSNSIFQINFGTDLLGGATVDAVYGFVGLSNPFRVKIEQEGENYYAVVTNETAQPTVIDLKDLNPANTPIEILHGSLPQLLSVDVFRYQGKSIAHGVGNINNKLHQLLFESDCGANTSFSNAINPEPVIYETDGLKKVELKVINNISGEFSIAAKSVNVSPLISPDIAFSSQNSCANHDINFTPQNTSGDITNYNWDFGDTNTSVLQNPAHQYLSAGDYTTKLEVTASNGCTNFVSEDITVYNVPVANFTLPTATPICTNQEYGFVNSSTYDVGSNPTWEWRVNGILVSSSQDLTYAIPTATAQEVRLKAFIPGCEHESIQTISSVNAGPLTDFSVTGQCEQSNILFTNTSIGSISTFSWDFDDGNNSSAESPSHVYAVPNTYQVTLSTTNTAGCQNSERKTINIYSKPQPDFSLDLPPFSCSGKPSQFNDLTPNPTDSNLDSWSWGFNDPGNGTSSARNPLYTFASPNSYNVNLSVSTNFGCEKNITKAVTIFQSPAANFLHSATCLNQTSQFTDDSGSANKAWSWNMGTISYSVQNPTHVFSTSGNRNVTLTVTGNNDCVSVFTKMINVPVPPVLDFSVQSHCATKPAVFTDATPVGSDLPVSYAWTFGTSGTGIASPVTHVFSNAGPQSVTMTVTNTSGCNYSKIKSISVQQPPVANFTANPEGGGSPLMVSFTNTSQQSTLYEWHFNDSQNTISNLLSPTFTFDQLGEYVVDLYASNTIGCSDVHSRTIQVVVPYQDWSLEDFRLIPNPNTGSLLPQVVIWNSGNLPIYNTEVYVTISGELFVKEMINATIAAGASYTHTFSYELIPTSNLNYVCAEIRMSDDADPNNNSRCINLEENIILLDPYPNPAQDIIQVDWIAPISGEARITIFNSTGQQSYEYITSMQIGLNKVTVDLGTIGPGIYYLLLNSNQTKITRTFVIR